MDSRPLVLTPAPTKLTLSPRGTRLSPYPAFHTSAWLDRAALPQTQRSPEGPATSTGSLASQRHPGKFPKVPGRRNGP